MVVLWLVPLLLMSEPISKKRIMFRYMEGTQHAMNCATASRSFVCVGPDS